MKNLSVKSNVTAGKGALEPLEPRVEQLQLNKANSKRYSWLIIALYGFLIVSRRPALFTSPRFWAEEASVYFSYAWNSDILSAILKPHIGYYSFLNNVASVAATLVPLEHAPLVTTCFSLAVQLLPAFVIFRFDIPFLKGILQKCAVAGIILYIQGSQELWLNTINGQFHLAIVTSLLLVANINIARETLYAGILLLLTGLTGPVSIMLTPLFFIRFILIRNKTSGLLFLVLGICAGIQIYLIYRHLPFRLQGESLSTEPLNFLLSLFFKTFISCFFGFDIAFKLFSYLQAYAKVYAVISLLLLLAPVILVVLTKNRYVYFLATSFFLLACFGYLGALDKPSLIDPLMAQRYFYAPNVLLILTLYTASQVTHRVYLRRSLVIWIFFIILPINIFYFYSSHYMFTLSDWPDWKQEVAKWRQDNEYLLKVAPPGFVVRLAPPQS